MRSLARLIPGLALFAALASGPAVAAQAAAPVSAAAAPAAPAVVQTYANIAQAVYEDSWNTAKDLQKAVGAFLAQPTAASLNAARTAWKAARVPYVQSEGFRFGNQLVDGWEPRVNSWPLDEGLIDYVAPAYGASSDENPLYTLNVIAHPQVRIGARQVNATVIDRNLLRQLQNASGVEANVATGYHAVEFLLWGQDLHGTGRGAGERPASDYDLKACTHGNCARRAAYLKAATDLLVEDLGEMAASWGPNGTARRALVAKGPNGGLATILTGLGSLSYGELAGERMKLGLILHDPEEEQDCFSDNTHNSHYYDQVGMAAIWRGRYVRSTGAVVQGVSLRDYTLPRDAAAVRRLKRIKDVADSGRMAYDQMIGAGNAEGNKLVQDGIDALIAQTRATETIVSALGLKISVEGSDALDNPTGLQ
jgi:putative iron-regulated protein